MTKQILASALVASCLVGGLAEPASARDRLSPGAAAAIGVLGGLAVGSALAGNSYYSGRPVYVARPRRVYVERDYAPECWTERSRYVDEFGDVVVRRRRVCE